MASEDALRANIAMRRARSTVAAPPVLPMQCNEDAARFRAHGAFRNRNPERFVWGDKLASRPSVQASHSRRRKFMEVVEIPGSPLANRSRRSALRRASRLATNTLRAIGSSSPCKRSSSMIDSVAHQTRVQTSARNTSSSTGAVVLQNSAGSKSSSFGRSEWQDFNCLAHSLTLARERTQN